MRFFISTVFVLSMMFGSFFLSNSAVADVTDSSWAVSGNVSGKITLVNGRRSYKLAKTAPGLKFPLTFLSDGTISTCKVTSQTFDSFTTYDSDDISQFSQEIYDTDGITSIGYDGGTNVGAWSLNGTTITASLSDEILSSSLSALTSRFAADIQQLESKKKLTLDTSPQFSVTTPTITVKESGNKKKLTLTFKLSVDILNDMGVKIGTASATYKGTGTRSATLYDTACRISYADGQKF